MCQGMEATLPVGAEKEEDVNLTGLGQKSQGHTLSVIVELFQRHI